MIGHENHPAGKFSSHRCVIREVNHRTQDLLGV